MRLWRIMVVVAMVASAASFLMSAWLFTLNADRVDEINRQAAQVEREAAARRDESCTISEREHLGKVERLWRTYEYLEDLPRRQWGTSLTRAIVAQLPRTEEEARVDVAPQWCDEPGVGLPEPDPDLPERRNFDRLLQRP